MLNDELMLDWSVEEQKSATKLLYDIACNTSKSLSGVYEAMRDVASASHRAKMRIEDIAKVLNYSYGPKATFDMRNKYKKARALAAQSRLKKRLAKKRK